MLGGFLLLFAVAQTSPPPSIQTGPWRATLASPLGPLPFGLEIQSKDGKLSSTIQNGSETIQVPETRVTWVARTAPGHGPDRFWEVVFDFPHYDARIRASIGAGGNSLHGEWQKRSGPDRWTQLPFEADAGAPRWRFEVPLEAIAESKQPMIGRWKVKFEKDRHPAVAIFHEGSGNNAIEGTILTATGDYRYLAGVFARGWLHLSCFDGAHAFLLSAERQADGSLNGSFSSGDSWTDKWTAVRDETVQLQDEMSHARWNDAFGLAQLQYSDLDGNLVSLGDARFAGRVRILQVAGSWCPNCHDETVLLAELDRKYRDKGLSITALCFELRGERERDTEMARSLLARHGAEYPALLAGRSEKALAAQALPALDRVFAFPTTVFLRRDGSVRAVHSGFSGPAADAEHAQLRTRFTSLVEELLAEPAPGPSVHEQRIVRELWRDERERAFVNFESAEGGPRWTAMEITRFDRPTRTEPLDSGVATIDGATVRLGPLVLHYDARAHVMLDASDVAHRFTPGVRSPFPVIDGTGYSGMPAILAGLSSSDALRRRESAFYLALQIAQDRLTPAEMGGGVLEPGLEVNLLPLVDDADPQVRATASWAAGALGLENAVPSLVKNLEHGFAPVRRETARALGILQHRPALRALEMLARHDCDPLVRAAAAQSRDGLQVK